MNPPPRFSAVLLAAGRSTRMARDKALLPAADGRPLWTRQREVLARAGAAEIFLSVRPDQAWVRDVAGFAALLHDAFPGCGPLPGITAGLERAAHSHLAVLAIDLPRMEPAWFTTLLAECAPGIGAVGRHGEFFEPLAAVYQQEIRWLAWEALARGEYSLQRLLAAAVAAGLMRVHDLGAGELAQFENWNLPGDAPPGHA